MLTLNFDNRFSQLGEAFFARVMPRPLKQARMMATNHRAAALIDLDLQMLEDDRLIKLVNGEHPWPGTDPLAMVYSGHQFGGYSPQLGDGRGLLLGQVRNSQGELWDLHLKGAGQTPFSRHGDGRAVLRSSIREYLASEALFHLGIPTTRALCLATSDEKVYRERTEKGASLIRLSRSHIRFGSFEYFYYTEQFEQLQILADYVIEHHFAHLLGQPDPYTQMLLAIVQQTAELIAHWQVYGFAHGVMNTDNMSVIGDTFDFGPYGFLDAYNPGFICNHSDHSGRYAFFRQPSIGFWNCQALTQALSPLVDPAVAQQLQAHYERAFSNCYMALMRKRLGLQTSAKDDTQLITSLLNALTEQGTDYCNFFRALCDYTRSTSDDAPLGHTDVLMQPPALRQFVANNSSLGHWLVNYGQRLQQETASDQQRSQAMKSANPKFILRNYLAQNAISAAEQGDYGEFETLMTLLADPFSEHPTLQHYAQEPPEWGQKLEISCSS